MRDKKGRFVKGHKLSDTHRRKISKRNQGNQHAKNHKRSSEHRFSVSEAQEIRWGKVKSKSEKMIDKEIKQFGHTWKSYSENLGKNPSNFKRQFVKTVDKLNKWLSPLNLEIQIAPKGESGKEKRK